MFIRLTVDVEVRREAGKFAPGEEIKSAFQEALQDADPGEVSGIGADGDSVYVTESWEVTVES